MQYSQRTLDAFRRAAGNPVVALDASIIASAGDIEAGAQLKLYITLDKSALITHLAFEVYGNPALIAAAQWLSEWALGKPWGALENLSAHQLMQALDLPASRRATAQLVISAIAEAAR